MKRTSLSNKRSKPNSKGCPNCGYCNRGVWAPVMINDAEINWERVRTRFCPTRGASFEEKYGETVDGFVGT